MDCGCLRHPLLCDSLAAELMALGMRTRFDSEVTTGHFRRAETMYSHCIACFNSLGRNEELHIFPVGRRLAFDAGRGRLWVICPRCAQWNLSPLEERWEAIEAAEHLFSRSVVRAATDQIGMAQLKSGLSLVRVGRPLRPEFAAWRYGPRFRARTAQARRAKASAVAVHLGAVTLASALVVMGAPAALPWVFGMPTWALASWVHHRSMRGSQIHEARRALTRAWAQAGRFTPPQTDREINSLSQHVEIYLVPTENGGGWALRLQSLLDTYDFLDEEALRFAHVALPVVNVAQLGRRTVQAAVAEIESVRDPSAYFAHTLERSRAGGICPRPLRHYPAPVRLALEMAAHEVAERHLIAGELRILEQAWRAAEEIAAIADNLTLSPEISRHLNTLRAEARSIPGDA